MDKKSRLLNSVDGVVLSRFVLAGAGIALAVILFFVLGVSRPHPEWPALWRIKPLIITPLAGAAGGFGVYTLQHLRRQEGWNAIAVFVFCAIGYLFTLWMGIVLGLSGTLWN